MLCAAGEGAGCSFRGHQVGHGLPAQLPLSSLPVRGHVRLLRGAQSIMPLLYCTHVVILHMFFLFSDLHPACLAAALS